MKKTPIKYGLLSLALLISLPNQVRATEEPAEPITNITEPSKEEVAKPEENKKLIEDSEIDNTPAPALESQTPSVNNTYQAPSVPSPRINLTTPTTSPQNTNYLSQAGKFNLEEGPIKVTAIKTELNKKTKDDKNNFTLSFMLGIHANSLDSEYTISVFALKNSENKTLKLANVISDSNVKTGKNLLDKAEQIESEDVLGFRIKTNISDYASIKVEANFDQDVKPGDYSIYYIVSKGEDKSFGKVDAKVTKKDEDDFELDTKPELRDYENKESKKDDPITKLPYKKYLINDSKEEQNLGAYLDLDSSDLSKSKFVINYIDPNLLVEKTETIANPKTYQIPAFSLARIDVLDKDSKEEVKSAAVGVYDFKDSKRTMGDLIIKAGENKDRKNDKSKELINSLRTANKDMEKALEARVSSAVRKNDEPSDEELELLTNRLLNHAKIINTIIRQVLLNSELESLRELELSDKEAAEEEYRNIALLLKQSQDLKEKAADKLIAYDEIDLKSDYAEGNPSEARNLALDFADDTDINYLTDLTDGKDKNYKEFLEELSSKLGHAMTKVETVTITSEEDKKEQANKENLEDKKEADKEKEAPNEDGVKDEKLPENKEEVKEEKETKEENKENPQNPKEKQEEKPAKDEKDEKQDKEKVLPENHLEKKDEKKEEKKHESKVRIKNSYPLLVRYLRNLNNRTNFLNNQKN
ncbi:hypothetical protein [Anaerococcus sp. Marseille-P3915]|uniref:hypothetical protein n=1 Tax=Anaerococcus sp. Marseille-P3915 TaxID=2057799 RepID=UPI001319D1BC|nr:hypothetical protein [Anaerococcus sp. Marseille-P3915]